MAHPLDVASPIEPDAPADPAATSRRPETSVPPRPASEQTGAFTPRADQESSVTGAYTPRAAPAAGAPSVAGYEIYEELGRGGMGVVYRARHIALNRVVALKMILAGAHARPKDLDRFRSEALAVARFQHANIVQIHEVGEAGGLPYFSLEFVPGGTLAKKTSHDPQAPSYAAETVECLARAMQYAHERGVVHRDLKPANVLLTEAGAPKITDFGLAKRFDDDSGKTQAGQVLGTPSFMSPEQAFGDVDNVGPPSDVYALGATLYDLLTGRPPFSGSSVLETLEMVRTREPVPPGSLAGKIPRDLETICLKCLQKDPARRYASATSLADDLRRFLEGRPIQARPVGALEKAGRWARRNPWLAGLGTTVAMLLVTVAAVASVMSYQLSIKKAAAEQAARSEEIAKFAAIDAQRKSEKDRITTSEQRALALGTVRTVLLQVDELMRDDARFFAIRQKIIEEMLKDLDKIRDHALKHPLEDRTEAIAFARIGGIYYDAGRIQDSAEWLGRAYPLLKAAADENPDNLAALNNLSGVLNQLADVEWRLGQADQARARYAAALPIRQRRVPIAAKQLRDRVPDVNIWTVINAKEAVAKQYGFLAFADLRLGDSTEAIKNYHASDQGLATLPKPRGGTTVVRRMRNEIPNRLGDAELRLGNLDAAEKHYKKALADRLELLRITPKPPGMVALLKSDVAQSRLYLGDFYLGGRSNAAAALSEYSQALAILNDLFVMSSASDPGPRMSDSLAFRQRLAAAYYRIGYVLGKVPLPPLVAVAGSAKSFAECMRLREQLAGIDPKDTQAQLEYMLVLARVGNAKQVEEIAQKLQLQAGADRQVLLHVAAGYAVLAHDKDDSGRRYRDEALKALGTLVDRGWKDRGTLATDPDFENLRGHPRFADLLARLPKAH